MKIVITGGHGQVGRALQIALAKQPQLTVIAMNRQQLDLTDQQAVIATLDSLAPDMIINAAAYNTVDQAETEKALAFAVNCDAVDYLADYCSQTNAILLHLSTDYVFDGHRNSPYDETCSPAPLNIYGMSKLAGEQRLAEKLTQHIIIRVSAVFSPWRHNFVKMVLNMARSRDQITIVNNQITCPTPADDIALMINQLITTILNGAEPWGCYHYCGNEAVSWYDFACAIVSEAKLQYDEEQQWSEIIPIASEQFPCPATRPSCSVLNCDKLMDTLAISLPDWRQGLTRVIAALNNEHTASQFI